MVDQKSDTSYTPLMYTGLMPQEEMLEIGKKHKKLVLGIPREDHEYEKRISLTPEAVEVLVNNGHEALSNDWTDVSGLFKVRAVLILVWGSQDQVRPS